jgi:hypothetical protein
MTAEEQIMAKYERANDHIVALDSVLASLQGSSRIERTDDTDRGTTTFRIIGLSEIPLSIPLLLGDTLHNLRSALDHLIWKIVELSGETPDEENCFPIFNTAHAYEENSRKRLKGVTRIMATQVDAFLPYKEGNRNLWMLHRLNILDKHRFLLTACHAKLGHSWWEPADSEERALLGGHAPLPLSSGDVLATVETKHTTALESFLIDVAINEPEIVSGMPLVMLVKLLSSEVQTVIRHFVPVLQLMASNTRKSPA